MISCWALSDRPLSKDIDMLIDRLQRGFSANKHTVTQLNGCYLITNVHLAKWMKTTQASVNKWIKDLEYGMLIASVLA